MTELKGKRVLVIGAARQGLALSRFLAGQGVHVIINDKRSVEDMKEALNTLAGTNVEWVLGEHPVSLLDRVDLVCVSGGVPLTLPIIQEAENRDMPVTNDSEIFMQAVKAPVIGITGSAGKTTTTTLIGRMASADVRAPRKVWVGGNIGLPLIEYLEQIKPNDLVILELSSFQLEQMTVSPHIAAVLNITPNHLDRHATMDAYINAKSRILLNQKPGDFAVLNRDDIESWKLHKIVCGNLISFGIGQPEAGDTGVFVKNDEIYLQTNISIVRLLPTDVIQLPGAHNLMNTLASCAIAVAAGLSTESMLDGIKGFTGVSHRLELVRDHNGVRWINDSIATAPERTLAAIRSFNDPIVLLLGGRDKNLPWDDLATVVHQRIDHVIIFGEAGNKISAAIGSPVNGDRLTTVSQTTDFADALTQARRVASSGDVVLLSPGCTSYDAFRDFEERGEFFREWVNNLP